MNNPKLIRWLYVIIACLIVINVCLGINIGITNAAHRDEEIDIQETIEPTEVATEPTPTEIPETEPIEETIPTLPEAEPIITEDIINEDDLEMLAIIIYHEAGGDACCDDCRRRVADVVLNRVADDRFPDTIEGVLTQPGQYNYIWEYGLHWPSRAKLDSEKHAVERAYRIAEEVLRGQHSELYGEGYVYQAGGNYTQDYIMCNDCGICFSR